ncbi:MAG: PKD domain-containing protein, partial [Nocardioides sp.]|nr:PKD domain-containing protein [Nocardioides sp.]
AEYQRDGGAATRQVTNARNAVPQNSYAKIPACAGNDIGAGIDVPCVEATTACGQPGVYQWWLYRAPYRAGAPLTIGQPGWERTGTLCATPEAAGTDPMVPAYSLAEFQRLPLPAGSSTVEPPGGYVLVTMPTNVFTTATDPVLLDTVLAGIPIQVRATPARWSWDFGDGEGSVGPTDEPGAAYPALTHTHTYASRGTYDITMTTHYTGEYTLDGATWLPIPGEAEVESAPVTVQALAGRNVLVAEP